MSNENPPSPATLISAILGCCSCYCAVVLALGLVSGIYNNNNNGLVLLTVLALLILWWYY